MFHRPDSLISVRGASRPNQLALGRRYIPATARRFRWLRWSYRATLHAPSSCASPGARGSQRTRTRTVVYPGGSDLVCQSLPGPCGGELETGAKLVQLPPPVSVIFRCHSASLLRPGNARDVIMRSTDVPHSLADHVLSPHRGLPGGRLL